MRSAVLGGRVISPVMEVSSSEASTSPHPSGKAQSESLLIGRNFGVGTDMHTGPNGNLFVVSLSNGAICEIRAR